MSSAGRGAERVPYDYYPTPAWCVDRLLDRHGDHLGLGEYGYHTRWLEPTVGDGAIVRAVEEWQERQGVDPFRDEPWGVELRRGALDPKTELAFHFEGVDFRSWEPDASDVADSFVAFDLAIGNPPFAIAESIIRRCLELCDVTAMLLRLGYAGGPRVPFWRSVGCDPVVRVIPDRPSFDGEGTDSATYAWFIWGAEGDWSPRFDVLDETAKGTRSAQKREARVYQPVPVQSSLAWDDPTSDPA